MGGNQIELKKTQGFLWSIIHKAVVVNVWRTKVDSTIDVLSPICNLGLFDTSILRLHPSQNSMVMAPCTDLRTHKPVVAE